MEVLPFGTYNYSRSGGHQGHHVVVLPRPEAGNQGNTLCIWAQVARGRLCGEALYNIDAEALTFALPMPLEASTK